MRKFLLTVYHIGYGKTTRVVNAVSYDAAHHLYVSPMAPGRFACVEPMESVPTRRMMRDRRLAGEI
jgi:hypothetical protein